MYKRISIHLILIALFWCVVENVWAANYPLEIIQPQEGLNTTSRYYKAYPGIEYKVPIGVFGGTYHFTYALTTNPSGMVIDSSTGVITWPNPTLSGSPHSVTAQVLDDEGNTDSHSWTITVTTSGFIFIDAVNGTHANRFGCSSNCGDGTINNPFLSLVDIYRGTDYASRLDNTYANNFVYFRGGTYDLEGYFEGTPGSQQYAFDWRGHVKPVVWLEYPGEEVIIDHDRTAYGAFLRIQNRAPNDLFMHGIKFQDMRNHAIRTGNNRHVIFECEFDNLGPGADGANSSFIMYASSGGIQGHHYPFIKNNTFNDLNIGAFIKTYSTYYMVIEGNTFTNGTGSPLEGIALKAYDTYTSVRANILDGDFGSGSINGNWNLCGNYDISFNKIINAPSNFSSNWWYGAFTINYHGTTTTPVYVYRNTFEGTVTLRQGNTGDGPFIFYDNVIVNENSGTPAGSHISHTPDVSDSSIVVIRSSPHGNLVGSTSDNIIDANGNLIGSYTSYIGTKGHQLSSVSPSTPSAPSNLQIIIQP